MHHEIKTHIYKNDLRDKTVVITGASSGAGMAMAIEFARHGAKIVLAARNTVALEEVETICREMGAVTISVKTDVTIASDVTALAATANEFGGGIDVWVNNAGVLAIGEFAETPIEIHDQVVRTNLLGYMHGAHAALTYFKKQQRGILINNISVGGWIPLPYGAGYSASKFGLRGFSESLRGELVDFPGIYICDAFPAFLDSPGIQHAANYTGHYLRPAPPVYDPQRLARAIVSLAIKPKKSVTVGVVAGLLRLSHALFPGLTRSLTAKTIKGYLAHADPVGHTSGNLFAPAKFGTSIHGGWNSDADYEVRKKKVIKGVIIGTLATGIAVAGKILISKKLKANQPVV